VDRSRVARLVDFGQSVWCDDIGRDLLLAGGLARLIQEDGVRGVTSNPTIFHKAITGSSRYDQEIARLAATGAGTAEIVESLMVEDIRLAADQLLPVYVDTFGADGYVSIEVAPAFAYDTRGTIAEVARLKTLVDRRNLLVKVPATPQGVEAVRELTGRGFSINVTLIFSLQRYREVMEAYISGLETFLTQARPSDNPTPLRGIRSVASFFVSRVDTAVDKLLDACADETAGEEASACSALHGRAAIANAKLAYRMFRQTFSGERWRVLKTQGATLQRPLWASTSTKNAAYRDVMYAEELIGPDTVDTMPLKTIDAFRDHGRAGETITTGLEDAAGHVQALAAVGISLDDVTAQLEREGVQAFVDSFEALTAAVDQKAAPA
jgi:transaldolase